MEKVVEQPEPNRYVFYGFVFPDMDIIDGPTRNQALINGWHRLDQAFTNLPKNQPQFLAVMTDEKLARVKCFPFLRQRNGVIVFAKGTYPQQREAVTRKYRGYPAIDPPKPLTFAEKLRNWMEPSSPSSPPLLKFPLPDFASREEFLTFLKSASELILIPADNQPVGFLILEGDVQLADALRPLLNDWPAWVEKQQQRLR